MEVNLRRGIIYIDDNYFEFGEFPVSTDNIKILHQGEILWGISYEILQNNLGFDYLTGYYVIGNDVNKHCYPLSRELFPYNIQKNIYNTKYLESFFENKQTVTNQISFKFIDELPYTFGLEFETAAGFVPQHKLYELGLIPLRDGSITGIEYSTIVLSGNAGLNLVKEQVELLDQYTVFDKDCSLHVHLGNFKLTESTLLAANNIFCNSDIKKYLPLYTFNTTKYKTNTHKNYCSFNSSYKNFDEMYRLNTGRQFFGNFTQPHPKDLTATRKWNINERYKAVNFINALCYNGPKTIEFRMLRPTYNFNQILGWMFIYCAIIKYAEMSTSTHYRTPLNLFEIVHSVYSAELSEILCEFLILSSKVTVVQSNLGDFSGQRTDILDKIINYETFGKYFY